MPQIGYYPPPDLSGYYGRAGAHLAQGFGQLGDMVGGIISNAKEKAALEEAFNYLGSLAPGPDGQPAPQGPTLEPGQAGPEPEPSTYLPPSVLGSPQEQAALDADRLRRSAVRVKLAQDAPAMLSIFDEETRDLDRQRVLQRMGPMLQEKMEGLTLRLSANGSPVLDEKDGAMIAEGIANGTIDPMEAYSQLSDMEVAADQERHQANMAAAYADQWESLHQSPVFLNLVDSFSSYTDELGESRTDRSKGMQEVYRNLHEIMDGLTLEQRISFLESLKTPGGPVMARQIIGQHQENKRLREEVASKTPAGAVPLSKEAGLAAIHQLAGQPNATPQQVQAIADRAGLTRQEVALSMGIGDGAPEDTPEGTPTPTPTPKTGLESWRDRARATAKALAASEGVMYGQKNPDKTWRDRARATAEMLAEIDGWTYGQGDPDKTRIGQAVDEVVIGWGSLMANLPDALESDHGKERALAELLTTGKLSLWSREMESAGASKKDFSFEALISELPGFQAVEKYVSPEEAKGLIDSRLAYNTAKDLLGGQWPEAKAFTTEKQEAIIQVSKDPELFKQWLQVVGTEFMAKLRNLANENAKKEELERRRTERRKAQKPLRDLTALPGVGEQE